MWKSKKLRNALAAMPSEEPVVIDLLQRYARHSGQAVTLERDAANADTTRERLALLREARGQTQAALVCLREASEHAHRSARMGTRVGQAIPSWLAKREDVDDDKTKAEH